jgi:hypothetical protein
LAWKAKRQFSIGRFLALRVVCGFFSSTELIL